MEYHQLITLSRKSHISIRRCYYHIQVRSHGMIDATASHYKVRDSSNNIILNAFLIANHLRSTREGNAFSHVCLSVHRWGSLPHDALRKVQRRHLPSSGKDQVGRKPFRNDQPGWTGREGLVRKEVCLSPGQGG